MNFYVETMKDSKTVEMEAINAEKLPFNDAVIYRTLQTEDNKSCRSMIVCLSNNNGLYANKKAIMFLSVAFIVELEDQCIGVYGWITVEKNNGQYEVYFDSAEDGDIILETLGQHRNLFNYDESKNRHQILMESALHTILYVSGRCYRNKKQFESIKKYSKRILKKDINNTETKRISLCDGIVCCDMNDSESVRDYVRHTESWEVRGHYRHYKTGKTVYIEPYIKGKGTLSDRTYFVD